MSRRQWFAVGILICLWMPATAVVAHDPEAGSELTDEERGLAFELARRAHELRGRVLAVDATLLREKGRDEAGDEAVRRVLVTEYVYEGDYAVLTTVDLRERRVVEQERVEHLAVPLHESEFERAVALALRDGRVREALGRRLSEVTPEVLLLRTSDREDELYGHRAVRMMFRLGDDYLSWPIAIVDLTTERVELEAAEPPPGALRPDAIRVEPREDGEPRAAIADPVASARIAELERALDDLVVFRRCCPRHTQPARSGEVVQEFPPSGTAETAWRVRFAHATGKGLYITGAWFRRAAGESWQRVLWDARLSDIFVPYHSGSPRYLDLTGFNFNLVPVVDADLGCCGQKADDYVVKEVRDRGLLWKDDTKGRRGHALVLWATLDAANYNYVIEYSFRDDGMISFRLGATARNLPGRETEAHMHDGLWRVDIDLGGFQNDSALLTRHSEPVGSASASDSAVAFNGGKEGHADWEALEFTGVRVADTRLRNRQDKFWAYDFMPLRRGRARHQEDFTRHDFWVTRYRGSEIFYTQLPSYVANGESVTDTDVVVWHLSPAHHVPRSEDGRFEGGVFKGAALLMWSGFDLRPRDLFDTTPFYP